MRALLSSACVLAVLVFACGGSTATDLFSDGGGGGNGDGGGNTNDGGGGNKDGGGGNKDGGGGGDGGMLSCAQLQAQLDMAGAAATACEPNGSSPCQEQVDGLCCPLFVSKADSPEAKAFVALVAQFKAQCGGTPCPGMPCRDNPMMCNSGGHCAQF